jgi:mitochondrial pyruvate carrier 2
MSTATVGSRLTAFWNHPAGPKTIHFWAPTFKWAITIANIADFQRPPELVSYPQQVAVTATGIIWSRFSTQITPVRLITALLSNLSIYFLNVMRHTPSGQL